ncbi:MAG TPA: hypothetical protein VHC18_08895 [Amycolatopsis sp.]|nr:hypothetical protein [Amycolatopsis sp.]
MNPTQRSLHAIAELLLSGPQYRASGTIRLRVTPGGFGTTKAPALRLDGELLVADAATIALPGRTYTDVAAELGVEAGAAQGVYADGSGVGPDETIVLEPATTARVAGALATGQEALRAFAPQENPTLWPEHFDVGIVVGAANYGVSPGDGYSPEPYAYVGPHEPHRGEFWNAPFGAARPFRDAAGILAFFRAAPL